MLPQNAAPAIPDLFGSHVLPEVVNVPVRASGQIQVMRQTGLDTAGTVGAADVDIESRLEPQAAKLVDLDGAALADARTRS